MEPREALDPAPAVTLDQATRGDLRLAGVNAALWAVGNGLISTLLITYLAIELGAKGLQVSLILAAPRFAGLVRLATPWLLVAFPARRSLCVTAYVGSAAVLAGMLVAAAPGRLPSAGLSVLLLVLGWSAYQLLEYVGTVLLWSWLGDLMPAAERGRLIGQRERWLVLGRVAGFSTSFLITSQWDSSDGPTPRWLPLIVSAAVGVGFLALAAAPLALMRPPAAPPSARPRATWSSIRQCLAERPFRRLLTFSCAFAVANGLTRTAQGVYPARVLGIEYWQMLLLRAVMLAGQAVAAPGVGLWIDRFGAKRLMFASQLIVATGPLFFLAATPEARWWIAGAFVVWIAYAGLNVGLDHQKLAVAPRENNTPAIATYHALGDVANGLMIITGGYTYDLIAADDAFALDFYAWLFLCGWVARTLVAGLLLRLVDRPQDATPGW